MKKLSVFFSLLLFSQYILAQESILRGSVVDENGQPIAGATVYVRDDAEKKVFCQTDETGAFVCAANFEAGFRVSIEAKNFTILERKFENLQELSQNAGFTLMPDALREEVVVTANRAETRLSETPASITTLSKIEISASAAPTLDDALRQTAGFSIFRRSSSRNANPTTQGVSLRGVGASGASRSLILLDGVPLNDAFGGWVQWNRATPIAVERVEVLRGGASSLYGNNALSGTINIISRRAAENYAFSAEIFGGTQETLSGATFFGFKQNDWTADFTAASFQTEGYRIIDEAQRGAVDQFAGVRASNLSARIAKDFGDFGNIFLKPSYFGEVRSNGTGLQTNRTHSRQLAFGGETNFANRQMQTGNRRLNWLFYGGTQGYDQIFSAVAGDRNSESLTRVQRVPVQSFGFSGQFSSVYKSQTFLFGLETREVRGASDEIVYANNRAVSLVGAGGREQTFGIYFQDFARVGEKIVLVGSLRLDRWRNFRALSSALTFANDQTSASAFPNRDEMTLSPQASLLYQITQKVSLYASASRSFRAPTLNELYRGFRVGNVVTLPNENLRAEKANNFEGGASFNFGGLYLRGNLFWTELFNPVSNVTLSQTPTLITRQRQNVGRTRSRGLEIEAEKSYERFRFSFGYLFADARVAEFPVNPILEDLLIPQVPRHQFTFQTRYARETWTLALQGRASSAQFDDDLNAFRLEPFLQMDVFAAKRWKENLEFFAGVENLFNSQYSIGRTPIRTVSSPLNLRLGIRWK